jgi:signal transduction histidine kinase
LIDRDPAKAHQMMAQLQIETQAAVDDLRDLARGIYPPLLADQGLEAALQAQARKSPTPVRVEADGIGRYDQDLEAAVYFSCLEAMQNIAKYANAASAAITLAQRNGSLEFRVRDDGTGFDPVTVVLGSGLQGMTDRIDAIGGTLTIESEPGAGTTVRGEVPCREREPRG